MNSLSSVSEKIKKDKTMVDIKSTEKEQTNSVSKLSHCLPQLMNPSENDDSLAILLSTINNNVVNNTCNDSEVIDSSNTFASEVIDTSKLASEVIDSSNTLDSFSEVHSEENISEEDEITDEMMKQSKDQINLFINELIKNMIVIYNIDENRDYLIDAFGEVVCSGFSSFAYTFSYSNDIMIEEKEKELIVERIIANRIQTKNNEQEIGISNYKMENEGVYISKISPLKQDIHVNKEQVDTSINTHGSVFFEFIRNKLQSVNEKSVKFEEIYELMLEMTRKHNFGESKLLDAFEILRIMSIYSPDPNKILEELERDDIIVNSDTNQLINKHKRSEYNIYTLCYIAICARNKAIYDIIDAVDYKLDSVYEHMKKSLLSSLQRDGPSINQTQNILDVSSNYVVFPDITADMKDFIDTDSDNTNDDTNADDIVKEFYYVMPYNCLITYIQQILVTEGCINHFEHATKTDILLILDSYKNAENQDVARDILFENEIGLHDINEMNRIKDIDFDYCFSLSIHVYNNNIHETKRVCEAASTYVIQVEIQNVNFIHDSIFTHIVYSSFAQYKNTALNILLREIKVLESGYVFKVKTENGIEEKRVICYVDLFNGKNGDICDLLDVQLYSSNMNSYMDYTPMKSSSELNFVLSNMKSVSLVYKQDKRESEDKNTSGVYVVYDIYGKHLQVIDKQSLLPHSYEEPCLYRTVQSLKDNINCCDTNTNTTTTINNNNTTTTTNSNTTTSTNTSTNTNNTKSMNPSLLLDYFQNNIFHVISIDMFGNIYDQCKRLIEIVFNFGVAQDIIHKEYLYYSTHVVNFAYYMHSSSLKPVFKFQLNTKTRSLIESHLTNIHSPILKEIVNSSLFDAETLEVMSIHDIIHIFTVILPLSFEELLITDCHLLHCITLFSTIIRLIFDPTLGVNNPKYNYETRVLNYLYELYRILPPTLYTESMHVFFYSIEWYKLHYKHSLSCDETEPFVNSYITKLNQTSIPDSAEINDMYDDEQMNLYKILHDPIEEEKDPQLLQPVNQMNHAALCDDLRSELYRVARDKEKFKTHSYPDAQFHFYNEFTYEDVTYVSYDEKNKRNDNCMVRIKYKNHSTIFGRLQYIVQSEQTKAIYFKFDKLYFTQLNCDSCVYSDEMSVLYGEMNIDMMSHIFKMDYIDILPIAYTTNEYYYRTNINGTLERLPLSDITTKDEHESNNHLLYAITSFCVDSIHVFDLC